MRGRPRRGPPHSVCFVFFSRASPLPAPRTPLSLRHTHSLKHNTHMAAVDLSWDGLGAPLAALVAAHVVVLGWLLTRLARPAAPAAKKKD